MAFFVSNNARCFMFHVFPHRWLAALALLLSAMAQAQTNMPPGHSMPMGGANPMSGMPAEPTAATPPPEAARTGYRSAFDGYQPFADSKLKPWKESNDAVVQAGGWRAYAKEAAAPDTPPDAAPPAAPAAPGARPAADAPSDPHAGHMNMKH
jgi:hypothetical protein